MYVCGIKLTEVLQRPPNKGVVVSKMMLHYEAGGAETSKPSAARRQPSRTEVKKEVARLNAAQQSMPMILQEDLCTFDSSELNSVAVKVKQVLPTEKGRNVLLDTLVCISTVLNTLVAYILAKLFKIVVAISIHNSKPKWVGSCF